MKYYLLTVQIISPNGERHVKDILYHPSRSYKRLKEVEMSYLLQIKDVAGEKTVIGCKPITVEEYYKIKDCQNIENCEEN